MGEGMARDARIAAVAGRQHGVVTVAQLRGTGLSDGAISFRVRTGRLHRIHQGIYAVGHARLSREGRLLAAVLAAGSDAVLSHRSAAELWGLIPSGEGPVDVSSPRKLNPRRGIRVHNTRTLQHSDATSNAGIPVTRPARTLLDLAATRLDHRSLRRAVREALVRRVVDADAIRVQLRFARGRRGAKRIAAILAVGAVRTRSELEDRMLELLAAHGFPTPLVNPRVITAIGELEVDFVFRDRRLVIEADGARFHDSPLARQDDLRRQAALEAAGYRVLRVTWEQVTQSTDETIRRLQSAYDAPNPKP